MKAVKISTVRDDKPILTVEETDQGLKVMDGNQEMFDRLNLGKFKDLDALVRGIHRSSELRVTPAGEGDFPVVTGQEPQPQAPQVTAVKIQEMEKKLNPILGAIKDTWKAFRDHAKLRGQEQASSEELLGAKEKPRNEPEGTYYVSYDGDNIGQKTKAAEERNDEEKLGLISGGIKRGGQAAEEWCKRFNGEIIESGGDEGMLKVPAEAIKQIQSLRSSYAQVARAMLTVGVGKTMAEAQKARELGKLRGKNRVVIFDENTEQELKLQLDRNPDKEEKKEAPEQIEGPEEGPSWSPKHSSPEGSDAAVRSMIKELLEEGEKPEQVLQIIKEHGLDEFPNIENILTELQKK